MRNTRGMAAKFLPAFVLLLGCAFVWQTHTQAPVALSAPLSTTLPKFPGYTAVDQIIGDEERRVAGMTDYSARAYTHDTIADFFTLVSYYDRQGQGKTIHSPRNCLPGAGWEILRGDTRTLDVDGAKHVVNHYILKNGAATTVVYYWYQGRGRVVASEYAVKWNLLRDAALLGHTEEALVRVQVPVPERISSLDDTTATAALAKADAFGAAIASTLLRDVTRVLPKRDG
jgi:EpsI family protein